MGKVFLSVHLREKTVPSGSLTFILSGDSLVVTKSVGVMYRMGGQLLSCPFFHSESFNSLRMLRMVVILAYCQSVVPSTSLVNVDLGSAHRNQVACVVALEHLRRANDLVLESCKLILHVQPVRWPGTEKICLLKYALHNTSRVMNSKCPEHFASKGA